MRKTIERRMRAKQSEIKEIEAEMDVHAAAVAELHARRNIALAVLAEQEALLKNAPKEASDDNGSRELREGSDVYNAREALRNVGGALKVSDLLTTMGEIPTKERRHSIAAQMSAYVREGNIFTRPAPNTFGLIEWGTAEKTGAAEQPTAIDFENDVVTVSDEDPDIPF